MTNKTRKHLWPVSLVMSIGIIGALAAFLVLASNPGDTQAHGAGDHPSQAWPACADMTDAQRGIHNGIHENIGSHGTMDPCPTPGTGTPGTDMPATGDMITSDSSSGGSAPEFQVVIDSLPTNLAVGSSIVLYLEDDYQEPERYRPARCTSLRRRRARRREMAPGCTPSLRRTSPRMLTLMLTKMTSASESSSPICAPMPLMRAKVPTAPREVKS